MPPYPVPVRLLLVEDNPAHATLVKRSFADSNFEGDLIHLSDGEVALDYLFRRGAYVDSDHLLPHLILLDLRLPRVDGLEVLETIKKTPSLRRIPVVVLTTSAAEGDVSNAYQRYVNSYIIKPVDYQSFKELMNEMQNYWSKHNVFPDA